MCIYDIIDSSSYEERKRNLSSTDIGESDRSTVDVTVEDEKETWHAVIGLYLLSKES